MTVSRAQRLARYPAATCVWATVYESVNEQQIVKPFRWKLHTNAAISHLFCNEHVLLLFHTFKNEDQRGDVATKSPDLLDFTNADSFLRSSCTLKDAREPQKTDWHRKEPHSQLRQQSSVSIRVFCGALRNVWALSPDRITSNSQSVSFFFFLWSLTFEWDL